MQANKVDAGQGLAWYGCGWNLFKQYVAVWLLFGIIFLAIMVVCFFIPLLGPLLFMLLFPLLAAGFYIGADNVQRGSALELGMLFQGFTREDIRTPLLILGGLFLGLMVAASIIMMLFGVGMMGSMGGGHQAGMGPGSFPGPAMGLGFIVGIVVQVLIGMCVFFAVPLATFDQVQPVEAVKTSFQAAATNILPFLLFVISYMILAFIASIPFFLGLIVLFPIAFCSIYCAYRGVFK
jgi:uncharacterized membrane protein